ncbi:MAG: PSD1 domain-containing protein [Planctomycetaceae bacterium]|nr:PSD1 domain-containing protein [Planctomycetaceae bacterium]
MSRVVQLAGLYFLLTAAPLSAEQPVDFQRDIWPIFQARCHSCHGSTEREGGLRLLGRSDIVTRNDSGEPAVIPGESRHSELIRRVTSDDDSERMPPEGTRLNARQLDILNRWIDQGATWPEAALETHWAYVAPQRPELPIVEGSWGTWARTPIDRFVAARLTSENMQHSPAAEPGKLLRRVYLDLIGIPPTIAEVETFASDPSPEHFEQIVDQLLASPRYGEKWARQWLDLARYADSNGFQADQFRSIWAYRDWVIRAMNDDMPYDQFTLEQLAGDLLPNPTREQRIATGFHRCTTCNVEAGVDPEENRVNQIIDRVNTTGLVWLGTSLECAQCHNHKYDPFSMQDYYQIFAFFNNTPLEVEGKDGVNFDVAGPKLELPLLPSDAVRLKELKQQQSMLKSQVAKREAELDVSLDEWAALQRDIARNTPIWHPLPIAEAHSKGEATLEPQADHSLLVTGKRPDKDVYELLIKTQLEGVTMLRLDCLTDPSLPGDGPGRGDAKRPNFVLYEFSVEMRPDHASPWTPVQLMAPEADFSQQNWDVAGLLDGDPKTGWAINPQFGKPHWARFRTVAPLGDGSEWQLRIRLPQHYGGARTIGRLRLSAMTGPPGAEELPADVRQLLAKDFPALNEKQRQRLLDYRLGQEPDVAAAQEQLSELESQIKSIEPPTSMVMAELSQPRMTNILKRGNFLDPGATVTPATPAALHPDAPAKTDARRNRLDFAHWLVSRDNPLIARVAVNRWWAEFFGAGLVTTLEDFGTQGERPTHPELLDWLAVEFMDHNWSMKHIHRQIVLSATYQQDSRVTDDAQERDPQNSLLARGPRFRLSAEAIRDNALAISGLLSNRIGGPPVYPPQPANIWRHVGRNAPKYETDTDDDRFRRGIYVVWRRSAPYPSFVNFDAPDRGACVVLRSRTNTPLQALTLLNDPAYVEMALAFGRNLATTENATDRERIELAFLRCLARTPTSEESDVLIDFLKSERSRNRQNPQAAESLISKKWRASKIDLSEQVAWFGVANILLNLDETITRN